MPASSTTSESNDSTTASESQSKTDVRAPLNSFKGLRGKRADESTDHRDDELQKILGSGGQSLREVLRRLLESGGDERSVTNNTGMTKYHTPSVPVEGIHRSCCTSNAPDQEAFNRGLDTVRQLLLEAKNISRQRGHEVVYSSPEELFRKMLWDIRERLRAVFGLNNTDNISLFPSGTDAELMPSLLAMSRALLDEGRGSETFSVVTAAGEVGSGTLQASMAQDFAKRLPSGNPPTGGNVFSAETFMKAPPSKLFTGMSLYARDNLGRLLPPGARDERVEEVVDEAVAELGEGGLPRFGSIVVHMVVGSKTGKCMPSEACLDRMVAKYGKLIVPVVDACQARMGENDIRSHLDRGRIVLCTGSKFFGGPPFSGVCFMSESIGQELETLLTNNSDLAQLLATSRLKEYVGASLMSEDLPTLGSLLPQRPLNYGVLMRWTLALHGMEAYYAEVPVHARVDIMRRWTAAVTGMVTDTPGHVIQLIQDEVDTREDEQSVALSTIVSFHCFCNRGTPATTTDSMSMEELRRVQFLMATDLSQMHPHLQLLGPAKTRCFMGQPVDLNPQGAGQAVAGLHVLRVAASALLVVKAWREGLEAVLEEDRAVFAKLQLILGNWFLFSQEASNL